MIADFWLPLAVGASFLGAISFSINGHFKEEPVRLTFLRSVLTALCLSPFMFLETLSFSSYFYLLAFTTGVVGCFADMIVYHSGKEYGGSGTTRMLNLRIPMSVSLGFVLFPESFFALYQNHWSIFLGAIVCIALCFGALFWMNKKPLSRQIALVMLPAVFLYSCNDVIHKMGVSIEGTWLSVVAFTFVVSLGMICASFLTAMVKRKSLIKGLSKRNIINSFYVSLPWMLLVCIKSAALIGMPNPGYYAIFFGLGALWVTLHHKLFKIEDHSSPVAGLLLMIGAIGLAYFVMS